MNKKNIIVVLSFFVVTFIEGTGTENSDKGTSNDNLSTVSNNVNAQVKLSENLKNLCERPLMIRKNSQTHNIYRSQVSTFFNAEFKNFEKYDNALTQKQLDDSCIAIADTIGKLRDYRDDDARSAVKNGFFATIFGICTAKLFYEVWDLSWEGRLFLSWLWIPGGYWLSKNAASYGRKAREQGTYWYTDRQFSNQLDERVLQKLKNFKSDQSTQ